MPRSKRYHPHDRHGRLRAIVSLALSQGTLFTSRQAAALGYNYQAQAHHVRTGEWERVHRGIYRLTWLPVDESETLALWALWSHGAGVVSHQSALRVHRLGDFAPRRVHLTVPRDFRRVLTVDPGGWPPPPVLHHADLPPNEIEQRRGYRVTSAIRSILDVISEGVDLSHLSRVIVDAIDQSLMTPRELREATRHLPEPSRHLLSLASNEATQGFGPLLKVGKGG